jgi:hypothetical protein
MSSRAATQTASRPASLPACLPAPTGVLEQKKSTPMAHGPWPMAHGSWTRLGPGPARTGQSRTGRCTHSTPQHTGHTSTRPGPAREQPSLQRSRGHGSRGTCTGTCAYACTCACLCPYLYLVVVDNDLDAPGSKVLPTAVHCPHPTLDLHLHFAPPLPLRFCSPCCCCCCYCCCCNCCRRHRCRRRRRQTHLILPPSPSPSPSPPTLVTRRPAHTSTAHREAGGAPQQQRGTSRQRRVQRRGMRPAQHHRVPSIPAPQHPQQPPRPPKKKRFLIVSHAPRPWRPRV